MYPFTTCESWPECLHVSFRGIYKAQILNKWMFAWHTKQLAIKDDQQSVQSSNQLAHRIQTLTLKAQITTAADDIHKYFSLKKKT